MFHEVFRRFLAVATLLGLAPAATATATAGESGYTSVPLDQVKGEFTSRKAILVDVREQAEWDQGHVAGAVLMPLSRLKVWEREGLKADEKAALEKSLPKGSVVYCHCGAGRRALPGGEALRKLGYDARSLKTGFSGLIQAGFPKAEAK